jgi:hypothetical protein
MAADDCCSDIEDEGDGDDDDKVDDVAKTNEDMLVSTSFSIEIGQINGDADPNDDGDVDEGIRQWG